MCKEELHEKKKKIDVLCIIKLIVKDLYFIKE